MSNIERNVYTENIHLREKFDVIYQMIRENGFVYQDDSPSPLGLTSPMIMEIFRIARKERQIEKVIRERT